MTADASPGGDLQRALIHAPRGRDAEVVAHVLAAQGLPALACASIDELLAALAQEAALAFVTEESLEGPGFERLSDWVAAQPPWSDFPFVVLASRRIGRRPSEAAGALARLGNVVLLERPLNAETLVSSARSAQRGRARQRQARQHLLAAEASRRSEQSAHAEARAARQALEIAVDAAELGAFNHEFSQSVMELTPRAREHLWLDAVGAVDLDGFFATLHPDDAPSARAAFRLAIDDGQHCDVEFRVLSPSGMYRWIRVKGRVVRDAAGRPMTLDGVTLDIGRQKKLEAEREGLLRAEREAREEAEAAGRMKDEFLATLSHELRTPLSAILGWTHLLARPNVRPDAVARAANVIERNARAQARLIEDLLDISRITAGTVRLEVAPTAIGPVFEAVVQALRPSADAKAVRIDVRLNADVRDALADPGRLQQVVWNLVSNAIKFTPRGGEVALAAWNEDGKVMLSVSDSGAGIAPDFLPHVFERFRQAESSSARSFGGLGLGLAIVRQLVELHGGSVQAASDGLGRGARFTVSVPAAPPQRAGAAYPVASVQAARHGELQGLRILVVDDEADNRETLKLLLEGQGIEVASAGSAEEGLKLFAGSRPDLLISDIGMPQVDGYELIRRARASEAADGRRETPAIALTAFARAEDEVKAVAAGFHVHLSKPVDPATLFATIASVRQRI